MRIGRASGWGRLGHPSQGFREWSSRQEGWGAGLLGGSTKGRGGSPPGPEGKPPDDFDGRVRNGALAISSPAPHMPFLRGSVPGAAVNRARSVPLQGDPSLEGCRQV